MSGFPFFCYRRFAHAHFAVVLRHTNSMFRTRYIPAIAWTLLIAVLSFLPGKDLPSVTIFQFDKFVHFIFYFIQYALLAYAAGHDTGRGVRRVALPSQSLQYLLLIATILFGFGIEVCQGAFTQDRIFDLYDGLANGIGAVGAFIVCGAVFSRAD
jgi:VanZ family protein